MRTVAPSVIRNLWQQLLLEQTGVGEPSEACTEGIAWVKPENGALTELEAMLTLSFRVVGDEMTLYFLPADNGDERLISMHAGEAPDVLEMVVKLADHGVIPASFNGGTRSDFVMRVDFSGDVYLLPPGTKPQTTDRPLSDDGLFLAERVLNFIEVL